MNEAVEKLRAALKQAESRRPKVGGFPYLAETLLQAGVKKNVWSLPSCQSIYFMDDGSVVEPGTPLVKGMIDVPMFNKNALIRALRTDQAGTSTFREFLMNSWKAGVIWFQVDFEKRVVTYGGSGGEAYVENYPKVPV